MISGCSDLLKTNPDTGTTPAQDIQDTLEAYEPVAQAADPITNGWAAIIYGGVSSLVNALLAFNQTVMNKREKRLGNIVRRLNDDPETTPVLDKITGAKNRMLIEKILDTDS